MTGEKILKVLFPNYYIMIAVIFGCGIWAVTTRSIAFSTTNLPQIECPIVQEDGDFYADCNGKRDRLSLDSHTMKSFFNSKPVLCVKYKSGELNCRIKN